MKDIIMEQTINYLASLGNPTIVEELLKDGYEIVKLESIVYLRKIEQLVS